MAGNTLAWRCRMVAGFKLQVDRTLATEQRPFLCALS